MFKKLNFGDVSVGIGIKGTELEVGDYVLEVAAIRSGKSKDDVPYFEVVHKVLESDGAGATPVGTETNRFCFLGGTGKATAMQNMKEIVYVINGLDARVPADQALGEEENWGEITDDMCENPATYIGRKLTCEVRKAPIKTPRPGGRTHFNARRYGVHPATRKLALGEE